MPTKWIDFRALKAQVGIRDVLERYGYLKQLRDKGEGKFVGPCPIHGGRNPNRLLTKADRIVAPFPAA